MSNENREGKYVSIPFILNFVWFISIYIAAKAGPIEDPIILKRLLIPIVTIEYSRGVARIITFIAPTLANDKPADKSAKLAEIENIFEWNKNNPINPNVVNTEPSIRGFTVPNFDIINPDAGPNIKSTTENGNWIFNVKSVTVIIKLS